MEKLTEKDDEFIEALNDWSRPFAAPIFFGDRPYSSDSKKVNNGTISLINYRGKKIGITCEHIFSDGFEKRSSVDCILQVNDTMIPNDKMLYRDKEIDIAILDLSEVTPFELERGEFSNKLFPIETWPIINPKKGDIITLSGFPGTWRRRESNEHVIFDIFSIGATVVEDANEKRAIINADFNKEGYIPKIRHGRDPKNLDSYGGLSGAPVFRINNGNLITFDFYGICVGEMLKTIHIRPLASSSFFKIIESVISVKSA